LFLHINPFKQRFMVDDEYGYELTYVKEGIWDVIDLTGISPSNVNPTVERKIISIPPWFPFKKYFKKKIIKTIREMETEIFIRLREKGYKGSIHHFFEWYDGL